MASHFPFPWRVSSPSLSLSLSLAHPSSTILPSLCFTLTYACACFPPRSNSSCSVRPLLSSPPRVPHRRRRRRPLRGWRKREGLMVDRRGWDRDGENAPSVGREEGRALETQRERVVGGGGCSVERESRATTPPRGVRCNHTNPSMDLWS